MAGTVIVDYIQAAGSTLSLNVGNTLVLTANASGLTYVPTGNVNINIGSTASLTMGNVTVTSNVNTRNLTATGTLGVTGATTLSSTLAAGNTTITGTLSATGLTTLGASTERVQINRLSDGTAYGLITLNGLDASTTACGIYGRGSGGDSGKLFITGIGTVVSQIAGVTVTSLASTGLAVTGNLSATGTLAAGNTTITGALSTTGLSTFAGYTEGVISIGNSGTAQTLNISLGTVQTVTMTGSCTFTMPTATAGKSFVLIANTGSGSFTAAFTSVKWPSGLAPTLTTTASRWDIFSFFADGTNWYGNAAQNYS
jgi:hypothetical protein